MKVSWILLAVAACLLAQDASIECSNGGAAATREIRGPGGTSAILKASTQDDRSKDTHDCWADYRLTYLRPGRALVDAPLLSSDGDWGRKLSLRLDGFSRNGNLIFGTISESGGTPSASLFEYRTDDGKVTLFDLAKTLRTLRSASCTDAPSVAGTTDSGMPILQACAKRWQFDPSTQDARKLPPGEKLNPLFPGQ